MVVVAQKIPTTFKRPFLPKRTDFSLKGIFKPEGFLEVQSTYRKKFGGDPFSEAIRSVQNPTKGDG